MCCLALSIQLAGRKTHAQELPTAQALAVVPPRLKNDPGAAYPEQALREHLNRSVTVDLVLEIDAEGHVRKAVVNEPHGHGFDEAAVAAAHKLEFEPAKRDERPVAARINFRYSFAPPSPRLAGRILRRTDNSPVPGAEVVVRDAEQVEHRTTAGSDGTWTVRGLAPGGAHLHVAAPGLRPGVSDENLEAGQETNVLLRLDGEGPDATGAPFEVVVKGDRPPRETTKRTLDRETILHSAGTQGDALLSLQNLPGVGRPPPFSGELVVRGSAPQDTSVFIDGTKVPLAYHFGGLRSVVPTELLDRIDFYPGNYSARYGRGMGGVIEVGLRKPKDTGYHGLVENSVLGFRLLAEGPIGKGWSFFASAQRSWIDLLLALVPPESGPTAAPRWADYQLAVRKNLGTDSSFRLLFFGSDDSFHIVNPVPDSRDPTFGGALGYHTSFWRLQGRFDTKLSESTQFRLTAAYGQDFISFSAGTNMIDATLYPLSGRAELSHKIGTRVTANVGLDLLYEPSDVTLQLPASTRSGVPAGAPGQLPIRSVTSANLFQPGVYTEFEIVPWSGGRLVPGARADFDSATKHWDIAPRINLRQDLTRNFPRTTLKGGIGVYNQPPQRLDTDPRLGQLGLTSNKSLQVDVGIEQEFTRQIDLSMNVFSKWLDDLVVPGAGNAGQGKAYGVEWLLRYKPDERFFAWLSYTMSRSERQDLPTLPSRLFQLDQTHVLTMLGNCKLGRGWQLGARFRLTTGDLYTPSSTGAYNATIGSQLGVAAYPPFFSRLPTFDQLDIRIEKTREWSHFRLTFFLDLVNAYFSNNPLGVTYNYNYTKSAFISGLPILPIIGVRGDLQ